MDPKLQLALAPPSPSRSLQLLGKVAPGLETTRRQIQQYSQYWASLALGVDHPDLVVLGDSLAQGVGASAVENSYANRIARHLDANSILNLSRSGARISDVLETQLPALSQFDITKSLVLCTVGSNDITHDFRIGKTQRQMSDLMKELPSGAYLATVPSIGSAMARLLNRHIRKHHNGFGISIADVAIELTSWRGRVAGDRFHPNDKGYEVWESAILKALNS